MKQEKERLVIYQVLSRLIGNENSTKKTNGSIEENGCSKFNYFTYNRLRQIKEFGFNCIWFTGIIEHATQTDYSKFGILSNHLDIVKGKAGSPYAIKDYYDVDPDLAMDVDKRMDEFEALIKRTKDVGLKTIIDFVPNHVSREYHSDAKPIDVEDLGDSDDITKEFDINNNFYYIRSNQLQLPFSNSNYYEYPAKATGNDVFSASPSVYDWYETIKLNYGIDYVHHTINDLSIYTTNNNVPSTWKKMLDILLFWASKGVEGFRCDMAEMVPADFWHYAISRIKTKYPYIIFIAEIYNPHAYRHYIKWGLFDYLYDKVGLYDTLRGIICHGVSANNITNCWQSNNDIKDQMLHFLENHDEQRIASDFFCKNPEKALPALIISSCLDLAPMMIYFGQEMGEKGMYEEGFSKKDGRTTIFDYWSSPKTLIDSKFSSLTKYYSRIIKSINGLPAIKTGKMFDLMYVNQILEFGFNSHRQYAFIRSSEKQTIFIVVNFDDQPIHCGVIIPQHAFDYLSIKQGEYLGLDYITQTKVKLSLYADKPTFFDLSKWGAVMICIEKRE